MANPAAPANPAPRKRRHWIENLTWVLLYGGLLILILGIATGRADTDTGWAIGVPGAVLAAAGVVLIYVRSRMKDPT